MREGPYASPPSLPRRRSTTPTAIAASATRPIPIQAPDETSLVCGSRSDETTELTPLLGVAFVVALPVVVPGVSSAGLGCDGSS